MKEFIFDWSIFKSRGFDFQDMCADIFKAHQYHVRVMEQGGSDEGRDIIIYKHIPQELIEFNDSPYAWVECKSQIDGSPINLSKISTNFLYVYRGKVSYLIFMTNHKFNNEAHNLFVEYNKSENLPFKIRYIEKEELENILRATPSVYIKYFDDDGKIEDYPKFDLNDYPIKQKINANSYFFDELEDIHVTIKNSGFLPRKVNIQISNGITVNEELEPFEEKNVKIQVNKNHLPSEIAVNYKIDHVYVDPFDVKGSVVNLLKSHNCIYICGKAGTGKSRLLNEVAKELNRKPVVIDISTDYNKNFLDYLLSMLLGMEIEYLRLLPDDVIITYLNKLLNEGSICIFVSYIKQRHENLNYEILLSETADFFNSKIRNQIIYIDNIHCFSILDFKLLERINNEKQKNYLFITARENEISEKCLSQYLDKEIMAGHLGVISLSNINLGELTRSFIEKTCADSSTKSFLSIYQYPENFQQFIFTLKTLRLKGVITQTTKGKILISNNNTELSIQDYKELCQDLSKYFQTRFSETQIIGLLELGAVYGYKFPVELIEEYYGEEVSDIIDKLLVHEFLKEDIHALSGNIFVCFDHELSREIIYNSIPPLQKKKLHKQIIQYIEGLGEDSSIYLYGQLAYHYESINNIIKAAKFSNKEGHRLQLKCQLHSSLKYFNSAIRLVDIAQKRDLDDLYEIEADSLNQIIKLHAELFGMADTYGKIRSLEVLSILLNSNYYKGLAAYYFARYYFEISSGDLLLEKIQTAINFFYGSEYLIEYANALNFKGIILKNNREFDLALKIHKEAIGIFENQQYWSGMSAAFADLGAVYLESGQGVETVYYWKRSLEIAQKTINSVDICNRTIDYSYILALLDAHNPEISDRMDRAISMADKLSINPSLCRTKINYSNFLFFSKNHDIHQILSLIKDAIKISGEINNDYLYLLSKFSYYTFKKRYPDFFIEDFRDNIANLLLNMCKDDNGKCLEGGDNRIVNIAKFMLMEKIEEVISFVDNSSSPELKKFSQRIKNEMIDKIEKNNPYFRSGLFVTYY